MVRFIRRVVKQAKGGRIVIAPKRKKGETSKAKPTRPMERRFRIGKIGLDVKGLYGRKAVMTLPGRTIVFVCRKDMWSFRDNAHSVRVSTGGNATREPTKAEMKLLAPFRRALRTKFGWIFG